MRLFLDTWTTPLLCHSPFAYVPSLFPFTGTSLLPHRQTGVCFCVSPFSGNDCASDRGGRGGAAALLWSGSNAGLGLGANSNPINPHDNCALKCTTSCTAKCSGKKFLCYKACTAPCYRACTNSVGGSSFLEVGASDSAQAQGFATIATQTRRRAPSGTMLRRHNAALRN